MIIAETYYTCTCDNCGEYYGTADVHTLYLPDESSMKSVMGDEDEWHTLHEKGNTDKHYCPKCYSFDDNDQLVIKQVAS